MKWTHTISSISTIWSISTIPIVLLLQYRNRFVISTRSFLMSLEIFSHSWYFRIITRKYLSIRTEDYIWIIFLHLRIDTTKWLMWNELYIGKQDEIKKIKWLQERTNQKEDIIFCGDIHQFSWSHVNWDIRYS
jgi:hypothetical protein